MIHRLAHLFGWNRGRVTTLQIDCCWFIGFQCSTCRSISGVQTHPMYNPIVMKTVGATEIPDSPEFISIPGKHMANIDAWADGYRTGRVRP